MVAEYRASATSSLVFARRRGLNVGTLRGWVRELRDEVASPIVQFVPLRSKPAATVSASAAWVEAQVGAVTLRFESGTDVNYMADLIGRLDRRC